MTQNWRNRAYNAPIYPQPTVSEAAPCPTDPSSDSSAAGPSADRPSPTASTSTTASTTSSPAASTAGTSVTTADLPPLPDKLTSRGGNPTLERDELLHLIGRHIDAHPRSQQARIGPSEIGMPCSRRLAHKLAGTPEVNTRDAAWRPTVGTAVHTWLETALQAVNDTLTYDRFYLEQRVDVGTISGVTITGACDCYDRVTATSIDWKIVGPTALKKYRKDGPGEQYRAQAHLYGRGWQRAGNPVDHVAVMFLPSNGELHDAHYWTEPYDEQIALAALQRAETVAQLVAVAGSGAAAVLPTADAHCRFCPYFQVGAEDLTVACPGGTTTEPQAAPATLADALN